jgi:hypothetical protein
MLAPQKRGSAIGATYAFRQSPLSCASRPFTGPILNGSKGSIAAVRRSPGGGPSERFARLDGGRRGGRGAAGAAGSRLRWPQGAFVAERNAHASPHRGKPERPCGGRVLTRRVPRSILPVGRAIRRAGSGTAAPRRLGPPIRRWEAPDREFRSSFRQTSFLVFFKVS